MGWREELVEILDRDCGWTDAERAEAVADRLIKSGRVVQITYCEDCDYCTKEDDFEYWCNGWGSPARLVRPRDYCSRAKEFRRVDNG